MTYFYTFSFSVDYKGYYSACRKQITIIIGIMSSTVKIIEMNSIARNPLNTRQYRH